MLEWTVGDIVQAVKGELVAGEAETRITGIETDSREIRAGNLFVTLAGERFDGLEFVESAAGAGASAFLVKGGRLPSPLPVPDRAFIAVKDPLKALGDLARAHLARLSATRVAVTGSVGKTSTRRLTASGIAGEKNLLEAEKNYNNLIGVPKTAFRAEPEHEVILFELGTDRPGEIRRLTEIVQPDLGVITHVGPSHLGRFKTVETVADEKSDLFRGLTGGPLTAIYNSAAQERQTVDLAAGERALLYGSEKDSDLWAHEIELNENGAASFLLDGSKRWKERAGEEKRRWQLSVPGAHQVTNALAAIAVGRRLGVSWDALHHGVTSYEGFSGRLTTRRLPNNVLLLEDVYNANPLSMRTALETLARVESKRRVAVLGDMLDLGENTAQYHEDLGREAARRGVDLLIVCGERVEDVFRGARDEGMELDQLVAASDAQAAGQAALTRLHPGDAVLVKGSRGLTMEKAVVIIEQH